MCTGIRTIVGVDLTSFKGVLEHTRAIMCVD